MQSNERSERKQLDQPLNEKEKESRQIDLKNADSSDLRSSLDTGIIDQQQKQPSMLHGLDECSPARYPTSTVWECESATPMTSRPHFSPHFKRPHRPQKHSPILQASLAATRHVRQRSKSLGSEYHDERMALLFGEPDWIRPTLGLYGTMQTRRGSGDKAEAHEKRKNSTSSGSAANSERLESNTTAAVPEPVIDGRATTNLGTIVADASTAFDTTSNPVWIDVLYGIINATMVLPITMSFASIIYRDDAFAPYIPIFVKLTIASGVVHQLCFSTFSSLPFAVGQVQDAGLIFLSGMATNIVQYCQAPNNNASLETMLATVTIGLSLATALLGCGLLLVGHLRLAAYMQLLPTCVVGGYLAFIGFFCGMAGVGLMVGSSELTYPLVTHKMMFILPGVLGGLLLYLAVTRLRHMAALPVSILLEIVLFYGILAWTGTSVSEATSQGWIRHMDPEPVWYASWRFLQWDKVDWAALPKLIATQWLAMLFVCALSSSLDVVALELELNRPLDYNHELKMIGLSNILSGCTGGYTGSYIFSQSIFSLRAGIRSRVAGYVLAFCEILFIVLPFPILAYVPNFFFGSLLSLISIDLMYEWLWDIRKKLTHIEYGICLSTFAMINLLKVEYGILMGVVMFLACKKMGLNVDISKCSSTLNNDANES